MTHFALNRRRMIQAGAASLAVPAAGQVLAGDTGKTPQVEPVVEKGIAWYNPEHWGVEGRGWDRTLRYYDRLPAEARKRVRPAVWNLSRHSAGMCVHFATDARTIYARYRLLSSRVAMFHMPATGVSGLDLYVKLPDRGWHWLGISRPRGQQVEDPLAAGLDPTDKPRRFVVYLPLYNGVEKLQIGVPQGAEFRPIPPRRTGLLVYYGTSITQGACASRPGMAFPAILGRRLGCPVVNLGFSGNGRLEPELADLMGQLDAAAYGVDCLPNLGPEEVAKRTVPFVLRLRKLRPQVPIVLVEDRFYADSVLVTSRRKRNQGNHRAFREKYQELLRMGVKGLHYVRAERLLGSDGEATTDGSHPNDLGMMRMADALEGVFAPLLKKA